MDDYYEFKHAMKFKLRSGTYIGRLTMCLLPKYLFPP
jgi:hypothetical protein